MSRLQPEVLTRSFANFLALGLGTGLAPKAPGTVGTLLAVPLLFVLPPEPALYLVAVSFLFAIGVWCCGACATDLGEHDHGGIVWDEVVGYLIAMTAVPRTLGFVILGFLFFRLFDILKPWPIGPIDKRVHGGLGIMLDDVLAGVFTAIVLHVLLQLPGITDWPLF